MGGSGGWAGNRAWGEGREGIVGLNRSWGGTHGRAGRVGKLNIIMGHWAMGEV